MASPVSSGGAGVGFVRIRFILFWTNTLSVLGTKAILPLCERSFVKMGSRVLGLGGGEEMLVGCVGWREVVVMERGLVGVKGGGKRVGKGWGGV